MLTHHLSLTSICVIPETTDSVCWKGSSTRQPWYVWLVSLLGSCAPRWICSSLQMPHLYWADTVLCIRQRQTPWRTTSCTQHMPHASCTWHLNSFLGSIKLVLGWESTQSYTSSFLKLHIVSDAILPPYCSCIRIYFREQGGYVSWHHSKVMKSQAWLFLCEMEYAAFLWVFPQVAL